MNNIEVRLRIDYSITLPLTYFDDKDYQDYFAKWLIRHGCIVLASDKVDELKIRNRETKEVVEDPHLWLKVLEESFRKDVIGL